MSIPRFVFPCFLILFLCTCARAQRMPFAEYRDSIRKIIDTTTNERTAFLQYVRTYNHVSARDTTMVSAYEDTLRSFEGKIEADYFAAHYNLEVALKRRYQRRFSEARKMLPAAVAAFKKIDSVQYAPSIGRAYQVGSILGLSTQDYGYAHDQATAAIRYFRITPGEENNLAGTLANLGTILQQTGLNEEALSPLREAESIYRRLQRPERYFNPVLNQGNCHQNLGNLDSAEVYYLKALEAIDEQARPNAGQRAYVQTNLAGIYMKREDLSKAEALLTDATTVFEQLGAKREFSAAAGTLARVYNRTGRYQASITTGREALNNSRSFPAYRREVLETQTLNFVAVSQKDSAEYYLNELLKANEEREKKELEKSVANAEAEFQNSLKQEQIERLELEEQVNQQRIRQQRWLLIIAVGVLSLLGFLAFRLFRQRQRITEQNSVISGALADKETLLKEIHHRVKNNLQMVSSLLSLQGRYLEDDGAKAALKMGNSRVRSMALIHQKLYLRDEVSTSVNAREYLEKLVEELVASLGRPDLDLTLNLDVMDTEIDIDRMIPIGLIANELVTNSLKYAFPERNRGHLALSLLPKGEKHLLTVKDDGIGMPSEPSNSFGLRLVESLAGQLGGEVITDGASGTEVRVSF